MLLDYNKKFNCKRSVNGGGLVNKSVNPPTELQLPNYFYK